MPNQNPPVNAFKKGNQQHQLPHAAGRPKAFPTPDSLWQAACRYFQHCADNPLHGYAFHYHKLVEIYRVQAMSLRGLYLHLGVANLQNYRRDLLYTPIIERIKQVVYVHNFTGAAAGILNYKIIKQKLFPELLMPDLDHTLLINSIIYHKERSKQNN